jgi:hypothetical protein
VETFLNAIWAVVCAGLLLAWHGHWLSQIRRRVHAGAVRQSFISLVCLLALLFPAISLSDDLHQDVLALPDTKSSSVAALSHSQSGANAPTDRLHASAGLPTHPFAHGPLSPVSALPPSEGRIDLLASAVGPFSGRAPPALL